MLPGELHCSGGDLQRVARLRDHRCREGSETFEDVVAHEGFAGRHAFPRYWRREGARQGGTGMMRLIRPDEVLAGWQPAKL